jgi:hypothetical protein
VLVEVSASFNLPLRIIVDFVLIIKYNSGTGSETPVTARSVDSKGENTMAVTMMRRRAATPERWQAALRRALDEGVQVRQLAGSGMWVATSGSDLNIAYEVSPFMCECQAGQFGDPVCKHRARFWFDQGRLDLLDDPAAA